MNRDKILFIRKNHLIFNQKHELIFEGTCHNGKHPSINAAKRKSRELQNEHGQGCVAISTWAQPKPTGN